MDVPDVALADEHTSVVDGLGKAKLVDTGLETALQEILDLQGKHVIELHAGLVEHTDTDQTADEGIAFEETLGVLLVEGEQLTAMVVSGRFRRDKSVQCIPGSTTDLGEGELDTPHLTLVAQTVLADNLQLGVTVDMLGTV
ncbi:40S ribosomal protein S9-B [Teratosphaeria destructans]|uniref:40S ribosomal protein S9-B n=1 Tax=Teratosphaeria destructans TaxID=418781 RepID=A0A9W7SMN5_9PEZI|nr:40S ribosomal protein S9-B [Teratosphaeria destructans]